jgi:phenylacetate-CoA ligase
MYVTLARHIVYPLGDAVLRTNVMKYLASLEKTQWWPPERLAELQNQKLCSLIHHAYNKVPYYRRVFDERGLSVRDIQTIDDLPKLPVLTKDLIRHNFTDLMPQDSRKWRPYLESSSGSTGEPLRYYTTMDAASISWAGEFRAWAWAGYRLGDKRVTLAGSALVPSKRPSISQRLRWFAERNMPLSAVHVTQDTMASYAERIERYRPGFLRGYPTALHLFAEYLKRRGIFLRGIKAVFTTAEMLLPNYRQTIESQFACQVFDHYGCYDGGPQALECVTHDGYHITAEKAIMEFVDSDGKSAGPERPADILATDLHNYAMPFIRYAVGDRAILSGSPCSCGRGLTLIKSLEGRTTDVIRLDNGIVLSGPAVTLIFRDCRIKQYQVVQTAGNSLLVRVVKGEQYTQADTDYFTGLIRSHVGQEIEIVVEFVDEIATTKAGKHKFIVSAVSGV